METREGVKVINCPKCGGQLDVPPGKELCTCKYCMSSVRIPKSDAEFRLIKDEKIEVTVGGETKVYDSVEEMPPDLRERFLQLKDQTTDFSNLLNTRAKGVRCTYTINGVTYHSLDEVPEEYRNIILNPQTGLSPSGTPLSPDMHIKHSKTVVSAKSDAPDIRFSYPGDISPDDVPESVYNYVLGRYGPVINDPEARGVIIAYCPGCQAEAEYKTSFLGTRKCTRCKARVIILDIRYRDIRVH